MGLLDNLFKSKPLPDDDAVVAAARRTVELEQARLREAEAAEAATPKTQPPARHAPAPVARAYAPRSLGQVVAPHRPLEKKIRLSAAGAARPGEIRLTLGDVLPRIPPALLNDAPRDPKRALHFQIEHVTADIARGRAEVHLSRIAEQVPDIFHAPITSETEMMIRLPLQKLVEQIGFGTTRPAPSAPAVLPPAAPPLALSQPAPESVPAPAVLGAGIPRDAKVALPLAAVLKSVPPEMIVAKLPPIAPEDRLVLPFGPLESQLESGEVSISAIRFVFSLPPHLQSCFDARDGGRILLPLEEIHAALADLGATAPVRPPGGTVELVEASVPAPAAATPAPAVVTEFHPPSPPAPAPQPAGPPADATLPTTALPSLTTPTDQPLTQPGPAPVENPATPTAPLTLSAEESIAPAQGMPTPVEAVNPPGEAVNPHAEGIDILAQEESIPAKVEAQSAEAITSAAHAAPPDEAGIPAVIFPGPHRIAPPPIRPVDEAIGSPAASLFPEPPGFPMQPPIPASAAMPEPVAEVPPIAPPPSPILPVRVVAPPPVRPFVAPPPLFGGGHAEASATLLSEPEPVAPPPPPPPPLDLAAATLLLGLPDEAALSAIGEKLARLPGLHACLLTVRHETADCGALPVGFAADEARTLAARLAAALGGVGEGALGEVQHLTVFAADGCLSVFARDGALVCALHRARAFLPGVRETLAAATRALAEA